MAARVVEINLNRKQYLLNTPVSVFNGTGLELKVPSFDPDYVAKVHAKEIEEGRDDSTEDAAARLDGRQGKRLVRRHVHDGHWDCCKPSCSWPGKGRRFARAACRPRRQSCLDFTEGSVCDGGTAPVHVEPPRTQ